MPRLTLSMIVKNEEKFLEGCLESVKNIADEIVVVDTGSTDKTIEIAKKYGAKIFHFDWISDFSAARNYALSKSTGKWILYLDADERLSDGSRKELKKIILTDKKEGVNCIVKSESKQGGFPNIMQYIRLFRNHPKARFTGKVHEQIVDSLIELNFQFSQSGILIDHLGYDISNEDLQLKAGRNLEILLGEYSNGRDPYVAFQIAQSYGILNDKEKAVEYFRTFADDENFMKEYRAIAYRFIAGIENDKNNVTEALELVNKGLAISKSQPLLLMVASQIHQKLGNKNEAALLCRQAYDENIRLLKGKVAIIFDIMVNEELIIYQGIDLSVRNGDIENFNFYYSRLEALKNKQLDKNGINELKLIKALLNNEELSQTKISEYSSVINSVNSNLLITLLGNYKQYELRLLIIKKIAELVGSNNKLNNLLGLTYISLSDYESAVNVFNKVVDSEEKDPSTYFYLISAYFRMGNWTKVTGVISDAEKEFANLPEVMSRLQIIKGKLTNY
ncbi:MAG: glycosyltransferase [bacterium]